MLWLTIECPRTCSEVEAKLRCSDYEAVVRCNSLPRKKHIEYPAGPAILRTFTTLASPDQIQQWSVHVHVRTLSSGHVLSSDYLKVGGAFGVFPSCGMLQVRHLFPGGQNSKCGQNSVCGQNVMRVGVFLLSSHLRGRATAYPIYFHTLNRRLEESNMQ